MLKIIRRLTMYVESLLLLGLFALAGITIMTNVRIELWCEHWLERVLIQPVSGETTSRIAAQPKKVT